MSTPLAAWWAANTSRLAIVGEEGDPLLRGDGGLWTLGSLTPTFDPMTLGEAAELLQGLWRVDVLQFEGGEVPSVLAGIMPGSGGPGRRAIRYRRRDPRERWKNARQLWASGVGDCEDIAAAVAAELTVLGIGARPVIRRGSGNVAHSMVQLAEDGTLVDPSVVAGMRESRGGAVA